MKYRKLLLLAGSVLAAGASVQGASAQDIPGASARSDEIVVTARRREERLQNVPIAITAVGNEDLSNANVTDLSSLANVAPGVTVPGSSGPNGQIVAIRGVSQVPIGVGLNNSVAVYVDGQYMPRTEAAFFTLDDVERIEVLRGPQGTLYGRNSTAGAINIITRTPGDTLEGGFDVSYGEFERLRAVASLSGPIGGGFSAGVSGSHEESDGYYTNDVTGNTVGGFDTSTVRGTLRYQSPDSSWDIRLTGDSTDLTSGIPSVLTFFPAAAPVPPRPYHVVLPTVGTFNYETRQHQDSEQHGGGLTVTYHVNADTDLVSVTSARHYESFATVLPLAGANPIGVNTSNDLDNVAQEFRLVMTGDLFDLTMGVNYYSEEQRYAIGYVQPGTGVVGPITVPIATSELENYGIFGQFTAHLSDQLSADVGLRYLQEWRDIAVDHRLDYNRITFAPTPGVLATTSPSDSVLLPALGLNWQATPDLLIYGKVTEGYQGVAFNSDLSLTGITGDVVLATPEHMTAYELGVRSQVFDRRLTLNATAFHYDYSDLQVRTSTPTVPQILTAGAAEVNGIEFSGNWRMDGGLSLVANAAWLDASYTEYCQPQAGTIQNGDAACVTPSGAAGWDRTGVALNLAPEFSGNVGINYETDVGFGELRGNVTYTYTTRAYFGAEHLDANSIEPHGNLNARLGLTLPLGPEIYLYGRNLTDEVYLASATFGAGAVGGYYAEPLTYGAGVRYHF
jgi:iron complex outermembrane recepter protein